MTQVTHPCKDCPFRTDVIPYLNGPRAEEIVESLKEGTVFPCHKTLPKNDDDDEGTESQWGERTTPCAGASIVIRKELKDDNRNTQIGARLGLFSLDNLDMDAPVFDSYEAFIQAQED